MGTKEDADLKSPELRGFWLTRILFLRAFAFIYCVGFAVSLFQNKALIGSNGILPVPAYMERLRNHFKLKSGETNTKSVLAVPTLFWFVAEEHTDTALNLISTSGLAISVAVLLQGSANMFVMTSLWALYHSIVNVGQSWYSFGWESQLLETGFLAIWLVPVFSLQKLPINTPTSKVCVYGYRWLLFRIMIGAGLIKMRGDKCWRDLTCMDYHYETQPLPNPLSWFFHISPQEWHMFETMSNHVIELALPWLLLVPNRTVLAIGGFAQLFFQVVIIISGNFSFLNWLTMLPAILCFDDGHLRGLFSQKTVKCVPVVEKLSVKHKHRPVRYQRAVLNGMIGMLLAFLSIPVVQNLLSSNQQMNTSFDSFRLVNTYGAFGSITKERTEVILEGTSDEDITATTRWKEFEFKCKPGRVTRQPCLISPYHYRLDWLMWFAAFQQYHQNPWFINLVAKLLEGDKEVRKLIAYDPFGNSSSLPKYIRAQHYRYQYTSPGFEGVWTRNYLKPYMPPVSLAQLKTFREDNGFLRKVAPAKKDRKVARNSAPDWKYLFFRHEDVHYAVAGLSVVLILLLLKLFGRELDMYYNSSVGDINKDVQDVMCRATNLGPVEQLSNNSTDDTDDTDSIADNFTDNVSHKIKTE